ncbi:exodeoxyribonuclease V subunit beta [Variovorax saccharolyticus]|uniref:exodeoxyribonuclease V subunit beta n=1 Tax=Variovorax saccharolyticus TaxID=3053516 RepID=UPI002578A972|nr:exodeoxyribonuclease V subunit beta [Variovorax sp. J31P216]MDM0025768.1 exodeoxyribonuclease V subunit beta [Variovorax sp. J31P216]
MTLPSLLEPLSFPLRGSRLIEASAGTGKTFTIAALYLRLVLGHGGQAAFTRPLAPPEILVVTFTDAATKELRDRIRARLAEAAEAFLADPATVPPRPAGEDLLHDLRAGYPPAQWLACARTLRLAAEWMDEAAVSTIHGWCNRMLREHAFDSGALFTQTLETDQRELQAEVVRDYWRSFFTPLSAADATQVHGWWATPDALLKAVENLVGLSEVLGEGRPPAAALQHARDHTGRALSVLKAPWAGEQGWAAGLLAGLEAAVAAKQCKLPKRKEWMQKLRDWAEGDALLPELTKTAWERLTPAGLGSDWSGDTALLRHPGLLALADLQEAVRALPDGRQDLLRHAARWTAARFADEQARRAQMGFDELLTRLDAALQGPNGERLAALIRRQFPVALIDEFQDTDPLQYRIFDAVYGIAANAQDTAVVLIGDPKQAIYAFRGADIHTYLAARRDTEGRLATLGTNFRSTPAMVEAVNRVFLQAEARDEGQGAFLFRERGENPLPFLAVQARGRSERWTVAGEPAPALTCWTLAGDPPPGNGEAQRLLAAACAAEIVRLLADGLAGLTGFAKQGAALRGVQPGDVAVLVNSGREATAVRQALARRGVRSVYLSDKDSVFQSPVAAELQRWLAACAEPDDDRPLRAALGSAALALPWSELDRLNHDELQWEARVLQFRRYQQTWRRQGVLPMLRHLLSDFGVPQRLLAAGDERTLTDLLHLAELLQQASAQLDGEHALIRWLAEQRDDSGSENEARKLRLESDADLVKVVTVHKSKGLEYPLVFLPFATAFRAAKATDLPLKWHDEQGRLVVALQADDEALARVDRERLGEDLRKLYVALTRARHATWIGVAPLAGVERSALGYLLGGGAPLSAPALTEALLELAKTSEAIAVETAPEAGDACYRPVAAAPQLAPEPALPPGPRERWWIASYSALSRAADTLDDEAALALGEPATRLALPPTPASAAEDIYADSRSDAAGPEGDADAPAASAGSLHDFPRGAGPGSFLHGLLEWVGRQGFARLRADAAAQADLADLIARRCNLSGWSTWTEPLREWLLGWLAAPLDLGALQSGAVAPASLGRAQIEMEFWFGVQQVDLRALDALVCRHTLGGAPRAPLLPQQLNGMLKGYIDLVFEHQGRYFVADYKSNWLGPRDADYTPAALCDAVLQHRYELQYVLYVFALHRLLRSRLADYDYERHVGGAVYLFLRGHAAPGQGLHCERPPKVLIDALDALFGGAALPAMEQTA